ncbi:MAG: type VII toxin-antitoxin system MntA family adenylyltransferase antitoxin [Nanoarchaeota archaeon]
MDILNDKIILNKLKKIAKEYDLSLFILFGSRAKKKFNEKSDYDFGFIPNKEFIAKDEIELFNEIMSILGTEKIDLINIKRNYDVKLRYEIFFGGVLIYEKYKHLFSKLKFKSYLEYIDFKKFSKNRLEYLKKNVSELKV